MAIEKKSLMGNKKVSNKKAGKATAPTTTKLQTAVTALKPTKAHYHV